MKKQYKTKARTAILEYLEKNNDKRFKAKELFENISEKLPELNITTVYRNLEEIANQGLILKIKEPNQDSWYYQYSQEHSHCDEHLHAQCVSCGKIFHMENDFVEEFEKSVHNSYGLEVDLKNTIIMGKCDECSLK